jgi:hypothetical protein
VRFFVIFLTFSLKFHFNISIYLLGLWLVWEPVRVVGIATSYWLDDRGVGVASPGGVKYVLFSTSSRPLLGPTQPPIQWVAGNISPELKRQGLEADHSPPASKVKKMWIYISTPTYSFMA